MLISRDQPKPEVANKQQTNNKPINKANKIQIFNTADTKQDQHQDHLLAFTNL
jgi:hypothetical protein